MKQFLTRITAAMLALFMLASFTACQDDDAKESETTASTTSSAVTMTEEDYKNCSIANEPSSYPTFPPILTFKTASGEVMGEVSYDEFQYYQLLYKEYFDGGDASFWDSNPDMIARVNTLFKEELRRNYAVRSECAKYGILLTEEEKIALDRSIAELVYEFGGRETFDAALKAYNMTPYSYLLQSETEQLYKKLNTYYTENGIILTNDADVRAMLDTDEYIRAKHILIMNDAGDDTNANLALTNSILERLKNGEDFDTLMKEYSEDVNRAGELNSPDGYYFFRGEMDENFENAAFALKEGELSDIVISAYGYHIILRIEKEAEYLDTNLASIKTAYEQLRFYQLLDEVVSDWETVPCENYVTYIDPIFANVSDASAS